MKNRFKGTKGAIILIVLVVLVVSYYYHLSNTTSTDKSSDEIKISAADDILMKNYNSSYPPTPKEVVKEYLQISKVLHNEELSDEQVTNIGLKVQALYDDEFIANKSTEDYIRDLKSEVAAFRNNNYVITNYYTSSSTEVVYGKVDGYEFAKLNASYSIRVSGKSQILQEVFLLRKDEAGRWKIYGWQPVEEDETGNE